VGFPTVYLGNGGGQNCECAGELDVTHKVKPPALHTTRKADDANQALFRHALFAILNCSGLKGLRDLKQALTVRRRLLAPFGERFGLLHVFEIAT
jgi:hypothetical protein